MAAKSGRQPLAASKRGRASTARSASAKGSPSDLLPYLQQFSRDQELYNAVTADTYAALWWRWARANLAPALLARVAAQRMGIAGPIERQFMVSP